MTDQSKPEIKKIIIDIGGKEHVLTIQQARELKAILDNLFGASVVLPRIIDPIPIPYTPYPFPRYWREKYWDGEIIITCCELGTGGQS